MLQEEGALGPAVGRLHQSYGVALLAPRRAGSFTGPRNLGGVLFSVLLQLRYPPTRKKITRHTPSTIMIQSRSVSSVAELRSSFVFRHRAHGGSHFSSSSNYTVTRCACHSKEVRPTATGRRSSHQDLQWTKLSAQPDDRGGCEFAIT